MSLAFAIHNSIIIHFVRKDMNIFSINIHVQQFFLVLCFYANFVTGDTSWGDHIGFWF